MKLIWVSFGGNAWDSHCIHSGYGSPNAFTRVRVSLPLFFAVLFPNVQLFTIDLFNDSTNSKMPTIKLVIKRKAGSEFEHGSDTKVCLRSASSTLVKTNPPTRNHASSHR